MPEKTAFPSCMAMRGMKRRPASPRIKVISPIPRGASTLALTSMTVNKKAASMEAVMPSVICPFMWFLSFIANVSWGNGSYRCLPVFPKVDVHILHRMCKSAEVGP